jgi:phage-related protein
MTTCTWVDPGDLNDPIDAAYFMDQGGAERVRNVPETQSILLNALTIAAEGGKSDIAKPMHAMGSGVFEIALSFRGDAYRVIYAVQLAEEIWVIHAFQKKSPRGIKTPKRDVDPIRDRLNRLKEMLG